MVMSLVTDSAMTGARRAIRADVAQHMFINSAELGFEPGFGDGGGLGNGDGLGRLADCVSQTHPTKAGAPNRPTHAT